MTASRGGRPDPALGAIRLAYRERWAIELQYTDAEGRRVGGSARGCGSRCEQGDACPAIRFRAIQEALRWGEPSPALCPRGYLLWAVPLMHNARVTGGLVAVGVCWGPEPDGAGAPGEIRTAVQDLLDLAVAYNLTNAAALRANRERMSRERGRAEAIHEAKQEPFADLRTAYMNEEPTLLAAVQSGDRLAARASINRMLTVIYFHGRGRLPLLRSFLLELVVRMARAAVEAGAHAPEVLGGSYGRLVELAALDDEERITAWLVGMLERLLDALRHAQPAPHADSIARAVAFMRGRMGERLPRNEVARAAGMSPSHFSRAFHEVTGRTFGEALARMRCEQACRLLARGTESAAEIALQCGFSDQSYFTKVFKQHTGCTPLQYRTRSRRTDRRETVAVPAQPISP